MPETTNKSKARLLKILIPIIAVIAVLIIVFAVVLPMNKKNAYNNAVSLLQSEQYAEAQAAFEKLGPYENSAQQAEVCANYIVATDKYDKALADYIAKNWEAAMEGFGEVNKLADSSLPAPFKDSAALYEDCGSHIAYEEAVELMSHEDNIDDVQAALAKFKELPGFEEADSKAEECQAMIEQYENYQNAEKAFDNKDYPEAKEMYDGLGDYKDSRDKSVMCSVMIDYAAALELYNSGENKKTLEAVDTLEQTYSNAATVVSQYGSMDLDVLQKRCQAEIDFKSAKKKFDKGDYAAAKEKLDALNSDDLKEETQAAMSDMLKTISDEEDYNKAMDYYNKGKYYDAYMAFLACNGYKDSASMADSCAQPFPAAGVIYANDAYGDRSSQLTIDNTGYMNAYYKLYLGEDLVMTVFIPEDGSTTFMLPAGTYRMTKAYGNTWYGTEDMFGDEGYYWVCNFGGSETAQIDAGYGYSIQSGGEGTGIGTSASDRNSI